MPARNPASGGCTATLLLGYYSAMAQEALRHPGRVAGACYLLVSLLAIYLTISGPAPLEAPGLGDSLYFVLIGLHVVWGVLLLMPPASRAAAFDCRRVRRFIQVPEALLAYAVVLFLFAWVFAINANMDYVQRFIEMGGDLRLALDTETERAIAVLRYGPFLVLNLAFYLLLRVLRPQLVRRAIAPSLIADRDTVARTVRWPAVWGLMLVFLSVFLSATALPSFLNLNGVALLGFVSLAPLLLALRGSSYARGVFFAVVYGTLTTLVVNFWLGTFSLVSLQISVIIFLFFYLLFIVPALWFYRRVAVLRFTVIPLAWTGFELLRSSGFLGYPWALIAHSQYAVLPLIQMAAFSGVWGISFVLLLVNAGLAELLAGVGSGRRPPLMPLLGALALLGSAMFVGTAVLAADGLDQRQPDRTVRIALIQQNSDPRKHEYRRTFTSLTRLTDQSLAYNPDIVAWSETAFVPNIRRWSQEDPRYHSLARLVQDFVRYQHSIATWLVTGNDDYARVFDDEGSEVERHHFNAAVLFSDRGERKQTYHKIRLVPFTEHFPYEHIFPRVHALLQEYDVHFWEPGSERTVFEHPMFRFSTPICFEDVFPDEVRRFVLEGTEVILNITNDYWSLTEVQAKQHFVGGMFRAVENRRPLVRSTASGLTSHVDEYGRILATLPYYEELYLVADVEIAADQPITFYTRHGDWFPVTALALLPIMLLISDRNRLAARLKRARNPEPRGPRRWPAILRGRLRSRRDD
ncbi:MAG: apolipoprotein N-acyltransferase [Spirochaetaceae bacterium]|nr:MAG: apolipoprotein N-acyltransferase [Spirochaetaceae bacterium]